MEPEILRRISVRFDTRSKLAFWGNLSHNFFKIALVALRGLVCDGFKLGNEIERNPANALFHPGRRESRHVYSKKIV